MMLVASLLSLGLGPLPQDEPDGLDPRDRYERLEFPLAYPEELNFDQQPMLEAMARMFGRLERGQAGETVELAALRLGFDPQVANRVNGYPPGKTFDADELFFADRFHRVLPGETWPMLAELYGLELEHLRALNTDNDGPPRTWSHIHVPVEFGELDFGNGSRTQALIVQFPLRGNAAFEKLSMELLLHEVVDGDRWRSLAEGLHLDADRLRELNHDERVVERLGAAPSENPRSELIVGRSVLLGVTLPLEFDSLAETVSLLDYFCQGDLEGLLAANGLERPEQLQDRPELTLPLSEMVLQFTLMFEEIEEIVEEADEDRAVDAEWDEEMIEALEQLQALDYLDGGEADRGEEAEEVDGRAFEIGSYVRFVPKLPREFLEGLDADAQDPIPVDFLIPQHRVEWVAEGETLRAAAARRGLPLARLRTLNPSFEADQAIEGRLLCTEHWHRVLPGDDWGLLDEVYELAPGAMAAANGGNADAAPRLWSRLRVPRGLELRDGGWWFAMVERSGEIAPLVFTSIRSRRHRVEEGQDLSTIAEAHGLSERQLRVMNGLADEPSVATGDELLVASTIDLRPGASAAALVHTLELELFVPLEELLILNPVERPEALPELETLNLPEHRLLDAPPEFLQRLDG